MFDSFVPNKTLFFNFIVYTSSKINDTILMIHINGSRETNFHTFLVTDINMYNVYQT